jgi:hypothetical protein
MKITRRTALGLLIGALACSGEPAPVADPRVALTWRLLGKLDAETGYQPPEIKALAGKRVVIAGFMVPLEDDAAQSSEFLLVPYFGACIHLPPPPPNQMIHVTMTGAAVPVNLKEAIVLEGDLTVGKVDSPYGQVAYTIKGASARVYEGS